VPDVDFDAKLDRIEHVTTTFPARCGPPIWDGVKQQCQERLPGDDQVVVAAAAERAFGADGVTNMAIAGQIGVSRLAVISMYE
jgi:hypothetical protein